MMNAITGTAKGKGCRIIRWAPDQIAFIQEQVYDAIQLSVGRDTGAQRTSDWFVEGEDAAINPVVTLQLVPRQTPPGSLQPKIDPRWLYYRPIRNNTQG
jgi:hypothetical protein